MRIFVETHVSPEALQKEKDGTFISQELIDKMAEANILAMRLGPGKHLHNRKLLGGVVDGKEYDYFHDLIVSQELTRHNQRGFQDGNMAGMTISLTAVRQWCNDAELMERVTEEVLSGKKKMSLAITEAFAGSDVAGIKTTAELSKDGKDWIINGTKKWIVCTKMIEALTSMHLLTPQLISRPTACSVTTLWSVVRRRRASPSSWCQKRKMSR